MTRGQATSPGAPIMRVVGATKLYGGAPALTDVDLSIRAGEVHALLGENGAGKSTITKAMAGVVELTSGQMYLDETPYRPASPREALGRGVAMVFQESSLVPTTSVTHNLFLGQESFVNGLYRKQVAAREALKSLNFDVDPTSIVGTLGTAKKQMVEIARAVLHRARVIIFDEPTTSLTPAERQHFYKLVGLLKSQGIAVIFITHAIEEALEHCDTITILRDGHHVVTDSSDRFDIGRVVQAMIGRDLSQTMYGQKKTRVRTQGECVIGVQNLSSSAFLSAQVRNNTFSVFGGQITGVFGLVGAGRTETFKVIAGLAKRNISNGGSVVIKGREVNYASPSPAVRDGVAYVSEDRKVEGFFGTMNSARNIYIAMLAKMGAGRFWLSRREEKRVSEAWLKKLNVRSASKDARVIELSGGNQQKVVIGRALVQNPEIIILDEPTRGVDVGAISEIHSLINSLADQGKTVIVISSYLPELMSISDRILVVRSGKVVEEFSGTDATEDKIMRAAIH